MRTARGFHATVRIPDRLCPICSADIGLEVKVTSHKQHCRDCDGHIKVDVWCLGTADFRCGWRERDIPDRGEEAEQYLQLAGQLAAAAAAGKEER